MKIIDLTMSFYGGMPAFPGDPGVKIDVAETIESCGWNVKYIQTTGHNGTHVNAPYHHKETGKKLDDYSVDDFIGECVVFESEEDIQEGLGVVFPADNDLTMELAQLCLDRGVKFVGATHNFEQGLEREEFLLNNDVILYENLANLDQLPKKFYFHGTPLHIKEGDGSPVRAYAIID